MAACFEEDNELLFAVLVFDKYFAIAFGQEVEMHVLLAVISLGDEALLGLAEVACQFVDHPLEHVF